MTLLSVIFVQININGNLHSITNLSDNFILIGFSNWKLENMKGHNSSLLLLFQSFQMRSGLVIKVMECVQFVARQGIVFQGSHDGNNNFSQLMLFHLIGSEQKERLALPQNYQQKKYTHVDYQNEILSLICN